MLYLIHILGVMLSGSRRISPWVFIAVMQIQNSGNNANTERIKIRLLTAKDLHFLLFIVDLPFSDKQIDHGKQKEAQEQYGAESAAIANVPVGDSFLIDIVNHGIRGVPRDVYKRQGLR